MSNVSLSLSHVTFGFARRPYLFHDLSFSLATTNGEGRVFAVMGPSGVGKSTLCDLLLGIRRPNKGSIDFQPSDARIGFIPQRAVIFEELSVHDNISCLKYSKRVASTFDERNVNAAIESLGLSSVVAQGTRSSDISGGEAQRVMLARIRTVDCNILILDEPCSFLDNRLKASFLDALRTTVTQMKLLTVFVTHVWDEARQVADRVVFLEPTDGRGVSVSCHSIRGAEHSPPSVDAFYAIHWPHCELLGRDRIDSLPSRLASQVPEAASFLGLYDVSGDNAPNAVLAAEIGELITADASRSGANPPGSRAAALQDAGIGCVFFDKDGQSLGGYAVPESPH